MALRTPTRRPATPRRRVSWPNNIGVPPRFPGEWRKGGQLEAETRLAVLGTGHGVMALLHEQKVTNDF